MEPGAEEYRRYNEPDPEMWDRGYETPKKPGYATMALQKQWKSYRMLNTHSDVATWH